MAKAPVKSTKKKSFKKKEKRIVHSGIVHIQATFNNTIVTIADQEGNTVSWSSAGSLGFPRLPQGHSVRRAAGGDDGGQQGQRERIAHGGGAGQRPGFGARIGGARALDGGHRSALHQGRHPHSAQRMPAAQEAQSVRRSCQQSAISYQPRGSCFWLIADR